ncbi:IMO32 (YGR031W) [Zygosaccharomyces parabailii]|nr:IMO32 (YGR031W) [Zygosaccharomyces parabailii]
MHNKVIGSLAVRHRLIISSPLGKRAIKGSPFIQFTRYLHHHVKRSQVKLFSDTAHKDPPTGPLFDHHNNTFETTTSQGKYGSTEVLNKNLLSDQIPSVELAYDVITEHTSQFDKEKSSIVILHGLFGNKQNNRTIGRELNELLERDVYLPDLRNHGQSPHIGRQDYPSMALDVERFIQEHIMTHKDAKKPILVGHSMGAKVAMSVALRKPELCSMLVCLDNAPVATPPMNAFPRYVRKLLQIINNPEVNTVQQADDQLKEVESSVIVRRFLLTVLQRVKDPESGKWRFKSRIPLGILNDAIVKGNISNWEFNPWVHRFVGPALFIRAIKSHYIADEYLADVGNFFPNFEVRDIDAGHWLNAEKPHECVRDIVEFVERHEDELKTVHR